MNSEASSFVSMQWLTVGHRLFFPPKLIKRNRDPTRTANLTHSLIYIGNNPPDTDSEKGLGKLMDRCSIAQLSTLSW